MNNPPTELIKRESEAIRLKEQKVVKIQKTYAQKYPILFALGGAFGLVATFYGFEKLIDKFGLFSDNPWILLGLGLTMLVLTGTFYNKLK